MSLEPSWELSKDVVGVPSSRASKDLLEVSGGLFKGIMVNGSYLNGL